MTESRLVPVDDTLFKVVSLPLSAASRASSILSFDISKYFPFNTHQYEFTFRFIRKDQDQVFYLIIGWNNRDTSAKGPALSHLAADHICTFLIDRLSLDYDRQYLVRVPDGDRTLLTAVDRRHCLLYARYVVNKNLKAREKRLKDYLNKELGFKPEVKDCPDLPPGPSFFGRLLLPPLLKWKMGLSLGLRTVLIYLLVTVLGLSLFVITKNMRLRDTLSEKREILRSLETDLDLSSGLVTDLKTFEKARQNSENRTGLMHTIAGVMPPDCKVKTLDYRDKIFKTEYMSSSRDSLFTLKDSLQKNIFLRMEFGPVFNDDSGSYLMGMKVFLNDQ